MRPPQHGSSFASTTVPFQAAIAGAAVPSDRRPGNVAHLDRLLDAWLRDVLEDRATAGRLRRLVFYFCIFVKITKEILHF